VFCVSAPSEDQIRRFISDQRGAEISYTVVGRSAPQTSSLRHCERRLSALALPQKQFAEGAVRSWRVQKTGR